MRWVIVVIALVAAGWLLFDGVYAIISGDYVTPSSGPHAGQLGPWSRLFDAVGIDPRSPLVKWLHVVIGAGWLGSIVWFALRARGAWVAMLVGAVAGLWYLPFGTLISLVVIGLLFLPAVRRGHAVTRTISEP